MADDDAPQIVIALYDFDPSTIIWPFKWQQPLPLQRGLEIQVVYDHGDEWVLGHPVGQEKKKGYYPKNYTVPPAEYEEMMKTLDSGANNIPPGGDDQFDGPPATRALEQGLPSRGTVTAKDFARDDYPMDDPEIAFPGVADYPVLVPKPVQNTTFGVTQSRLLREMPAIPPKRPEDPAPPEDDIAEALEEVIKNAEARARLDPRAVPGGKVSDSRSSTPATYKLTRPDRDFVRKHMPVQMQDQLLKEVAPLRDLVEKNIRLPKPMKAPYATDMRVRHTTFRIASGIKPADMKLAFKKSEDNGARWTQMFRPGFRDQVNESFKMGANAAILSDKYLNDIGSREQFQKMHVKDVNGILSFELQRRKTHLFYMRMDYVDVMMCHPDAWGFPDASLTVSANSGEPFNPFHGWYAQTSIDTDREMEQVEFLYTLRVRSFPEHTFQALSLGKIPEWVQPYTTLAGEAQLEDVKDEDKDDAPGAGGLAIDKSLLREAGLVEEGEEVYVKLDGLKMMRERTAAPDVLDLKEQVHKLKGLSAMRVFLRSRGNPDNMKQCLLTPKMVKDMAAQVGLKGDPTHYWYALFALRYPLAPEWDAVVRNDTRWYLHLPSDRLQPVHPLIKEFRKHLNDVTSNEFLWDFRGFVHYKCSECGIPDSVIWCPQCTDYFCANCFLESHRSARGRKHWPMPVPGSRYLTHAEEAQLREHVPLLNVGFSNRRRFLARDNQSDKMGSKSGDTWLFFHADTFKAALLQAPEKHWYLKRLNPPRLAPDTQGYYYNFACDVIADEPSHILTKAHEQKALTLLQKCIRGALVRKRIRTETTAVTVIQKTKMMWDCQKVHGKNGRNAGILKSWYRKFRAKADRLALEERVTRVQAFFRGREVRKRFKEEKDSATGFQASFRGIRCRRHLLVLKTAATCIQRHFRGLIEGRKPVREMNANASRIQAVARGMACRAWFAKRNKAATDIQSHFHGMCARKLVKRKQASALMIQRNARRFQAQLDVKVILYERLESLAQRRQQAIREKQEHACATCFQRNYRRYRDANKVILTKREKGDADKRTSTFCVALYNAMAEIRHFIHPWWRHLPLEMREVLEQIKASLQRTIALVPVSGKLANEEIGRRGLRVTGLDSLTYDQSGKDPDLASHMLLGVTRHLLSHVPAELFPATVKWACYSIAHKSVELSKHAAFPLEQIPVGKEGMPVHPGDNLDTLWTDQATIKHHHDNLMIVPDESFPLLYLHGIPAHLRNVYLTAEVLITMRQALDTPNLSTDDHLKFQGLDASAGAQLMEVLGSEMDHRLPLDWPKTYGSVSALATQMGTHITELRPDGDEGAASKSGTKKKASKKDADPKAAAKPKAKSKAEAKAASKKTDADKTQDVAEALASAGDHDDAPALLCFNRNAMMRVVQQTRYLMCDQDKLMSSVLGREDEGPVKGVRQSRYISVTDKLFDMAERAKHDHCPFVLSVVLYHMVMRALMLRVLYHRAAIAVQKRYRYLKTKAKAAGKSGPCLTIQRHWRGLHVALRVMRQDDAAEKIQHSYRVWHWNQRSKQLLTSTLKIQRVWLGWIQRSWLRQCHQAAAEIQRFTRGFLVRIVLDKGGRDLSRKLQGQLDALMQSRETMSLTQFVAKQASLAGKARVQLHKHRHQRVELIKMSTFTMRQRHTRTQDKAKKLKMKGAVQPIRSSVFQPMLFALAELQPQKPRYGAQKSRVLMQVNAAKRTLNKTLPREAGSRKPHSAARRGHASVVARRLAKKLPKGSGASAPKIQDHKVGKWASSMFGAFA